MKMVNEIKLDLNEIPYPPSRKVIDAAQKGLSQLNRYADPKELEVLQKLLADYSGVPKKHIVLGAGSGLLLREIVKSFSRGRKVIMANPSFFRTLQCARRFATKLIEIQLRPPEFDLNFAFVVKELSDPSLLVFGNPNNPTGKILMSKEVVEDVIKNENALLVVDEAYYEFSGITFAGMVKKHPNLAVVRTMSKAFGLAGARVGYLIAGDDFLDVFPAFYSFLPQPCLYAAVEAVRDLDHMKKNVSLTVNERERVRGGLKQMGIEVYHSNTNFLLVKTDISNLARELKDRGVLVLDLSSKWLPGFIRVSVGTPKENDVFLLTIGEILKVRNRNKE